jgi:outer membrane protein OmpA-like peptidoglycan-associated protein
VLRKYIVGFVALGLAFGHTAIASVAAEPPAAIVYFEHNSDKVTREAAKALDKVAASYARNQQPGVAIEGHADNAEGIPTVTDSISLLTQRRADNVLAQLVARGVPANIIITQPYGNALAQTGAPRDNRRAEVSFTAGSGW